MIACEKKWMSTICAFLWPYFRADSCVFVSLISYQQSWTSPAASFLWAVTLMNGWKQHSNLIFRHICTLINGGEFCWDSCALWLFPEAFSTPMNDWPICASLPFYWVLAVPRPAEADKQQMRCPVDDTAVTQFILLLFLNRKRRVESKQGLGNANTEAVPKQSHKKRFSLLSSIKFNFWGHAAVSHYSNVARMVSQLEGMRWKSHYGAHTLEKMLAPA